MKFEKVSCVVGLEVLVLLDKMNIYNLINCCISIVVFNVCVVEVVCLGGVELVVDLCNDGKDMLIDVVVCVMGVVDVVSVVKL